EDDIDSLLAEFDMPAESDDVAAAVKAPETSAGSSADSTEDDIDSLLAEFDMPAESDDVAAAVKAPETSADSSGEDDVNEVGQNEEPNNEDVDALLASLNEPVIESAMAENSDELPIDEQGNSESDDLAAQIAAELSDEDVADSTDDNETSDEDIDALLASLNEPVVESETYDHENAAVQAQIAAELDDDTSSEALILDDDESLDDDINALLASFKEDTKAGDTPSTDTNSEQSINDKIDDTELFDEFDEYLSDVDLAKTDNADDIDADKDALSDVDTQADSKDQDNTLFDAQLEAALALTSRHDVKLEQGSAAASSPTPETEAEEALDALLAEMDDKDTSSSTAQNKTNKDSGFFNDLKSNKPKPELLDWESDLLKAAESAADEKEVDEPEVSDDDLLAAFSQSLKEDDNVDDYTSEDEYILSDDNLTVDEALAALDQKERSQSAEYKASNDDVTRFERENSYIDIDKLLNDADEDDDKTDQYKDVNVNMGSVNSLISNADMVDVDDEENSVNAKLDLARAYIEIEDQDSARALLKEVQMDGNERQQLEAKNLIKSFN
uniref:FimV/HubP family polar landmark protein n=1 Tax=Shewanella sp. T24-MNA-CIBAN-0130 TaxID=3140470 RepID=UPI00331DC30F